MLASVTQPIDSGMRAGKADPVQTVSTHVWRACLRREGNDVQSRIAAALRQTVRCPSIPISQHTRPSRWKISMASSGSYLHFYADRRNVAGK